MLDRPLGRTMVSMGRRGKRENKDLWATPPAPDSRDQDYISLVFAVRLRPLPGTYTGRSERIAAFIHVGDGAVDVAVR